MPTYLCKDIPFKQIKLVDSEGELVAVVNFNKGVLELDDDKAALLDELIARKPAIARGIVKLDKQAVEEEVRKLREQHSETLGIVKGGITGATGPSMANLPKEEVAVQAFATSGNAEQAAKTADAISSGAGVKLKNKAG